jgi:hypothetical protein
VDYAFQAARDKHEQGREQEAQTLIHLYLSKEKIEDAVGWAMLQSEESTTIIVPDGTEMNTNTKVFQNFRRDFLEATGFKDLRFEPQNNAYIGPDSDHGAPQFIIEIS